MLCAAPSPRRGMGGLGRLWSRSRRMCTAPRSGSIRTDTGRCAPPARPATNATSTRRRVCCSMLPARCCWSGQGVFYAEATDELRQLAELLQAPVMTTFDGKSAFPEDHALALGSGGGTFTGPGRHILHKSDLVLGIGCSFTKHGIATPALPPGKKIIHATNDTRDLHKAFAADLGILGDAKLVLGQLIEAVRDRLGGKTRSNGVAQELAGEREAWLGRWQGKLRSDERPINPYRVISEFMRVINPADAIVTHDSGSPREQLNPFYRATRPRGYIGWGKSHQLGTGLGLAIGAKVAAPDKFCVNFMGDAAFGMTGLDFETAVRCGIPITTIVLNNSTMAIETHAMALSHERYRRARPRRQLRQYRPRSRRVERAGRGPGAGRRRDPPRPPAERRREVGPPRIHHQPRADLLAPPRRRRVASMAPRIGYLPARARGEGGARESGRVRGVKDRKRMPPKIGYLLPTRERVMEGRPETGPLLDLAARAEGLGFELGLGRRLAPGPAAPRPADPARGSGGANAKGPARHRRVSAGIAQSGRAGAPARHPRPNQRGPAGARRRHRQRRPEHPGGVRRRWRAVRSARRPDDGGAAAGSGPVDRQAGQLGRALAGRGRRARPDPLPAGRPADLAGRLGAPGLRTGSPAFRRLVRQ